MDHAPSKRASRPGQARATYALEGHSFAAGTIAPGLHIVSTPIGNLADITLRALSTLAAADLIACEDTRVTRKLIDRYVIATPLTAYHDHNAAAARPKLFSVWPKEPRSRSSRMPAPRFYPTQASNSCAPRKKRAIK